jgi:uncharacterized membrane protein YhaH (DUF805 family)
MAVCDKCEGVLEENSKFCPNCGEAVLQEVIVHINDEKVVDDTIIEKETPFKEFYFSSEGRIGKKEFLFRAFFPLSIFNILLMVLMKLTELLTLMDKIETNMATVLFILTVGLSLVIGTSIIFTSIKRYHDLNMNGWWSLLTFIPFINLIVLLWLLFSGSRDENNRYGTHQSSYSLTGLRWFFLISQLVAFIVLIVAFGLLNQFIIVEQNNSKEKSVVPGAKQEVKQIDSALTELERYTKACDGGYTGGCSNLAYMYYNGEGVKQDSFKAVELYKKACDGGEARGCFNLGSVYVNGKGVKQDYFEAAELYKKACDGGEALGCFNLGVMYHDGQGIKQNSQKALELYGKACDMKNELGCKNYAKLKKELGQ